MPSSNSSPHLFSNCELGPKSGLWPNFWWAAKMANLHKNRWSILKGRTRGTQHLQNGPNLMSTYRKKVSLPSWQNYTELYGKQNWTIRAHQCALALIGRQNEMQSHQNGPNPLHRELNKCSRRHCSDSKNDFKRRFEQLIRWNIFSKAKLSGS